MRDCPPAPNGDTQHPGEPLRPGELRVSKSGVLVGTATHPVQLGDVQQGGKRKMPATEWARGLRAAPGEPGAASLVLR